MGEAFLRRWWLYLWVSLWGLTGCGQPAAECEPGGGPSCMSRDAATDPALVDACAGCADAGAAGDAASGDARPIPGGDAGACLPESEPALCTLWSIECGDAALLDDCGETRDVSCGTCAAPAVCGALVAGHCDLVPASAPPAIVEIYADDVGEQSALVVDDSGVLHTVYTNPGHGLRYARRDAGRWRVTVVDQGLADARDPALAVTAAGDPVIAYFDAGARDLRVATWGPAGFLVEVVDSADYVGLRPSLAVDAAGRPHVAYWDQIGYHVKYATRSGSWQIEELTEFGDSMRRFALAIDQAQTVWVASTIANETFLAERTASGWQMTPIGVQLFPERLLFAGGHTHLIGQSGVVGIRYATDATGSWHAEDVEPDSYHTPRLAIDDAGVLHAVYHHNVSTGLRHAVRVGGQWSREDIDKPSSTTATAGLDIDPGTGRVLVTYSDVPAYGARAPLRLAERVGADWTFEDIDAAGTVGRHGALAVDAQGRPHVSYQGIKELRHAVWDGAAWWTEKVDVGGNGTGSHTAIAARGDQLHIVYHDGWAGTLRHARWDGALWQRSTIDDDHADNGEETSLALDAAGRPHVSYQDVSAYDLRYARHDGTQWLVEVVDSYGTCGEGSSLALDDQGRAHISYLYGQTDDLRYATWTGVAWHTETVDAAARVKGDTALALTPDDRPCIAYHDLAGDELRLTCRDTAGDWSATILDADATSVSSRLDLVIEPTGTIHLIVWYGDAELRYFTGQPGAIVAVTVPVERMGGWPGLAVDGAGGVFATAYRKPGYASIDAAPLLVRLSGP